VGILVTTFAGMRQAVVEREATLKTRAQQQAAVAELGQNALMGADLLVGSVLDLLSLLENRATFHVQHS
jgi:hypothetical protein